MTAVMDVSLVLMLLLVAASIAMLVFWLLRHAGGLQQQRLHALGRELEQAFGLGFVAISPQTVLRLGRLAAWALVAVIGLLSGSWVLAGITALAALISPTLLMQRWLEQRRRKLDAQWPEALLSLASALRAGVALSPAVRKLADESPSPLADELQWLLQQQRLGLGFSDGLGQLAVRVNTRATTLVVAALQTALESGGGLADALERIALRISTQLQLQGKARTLSAQGRLQAGVLAFIPVLLGLALMVLEPEAMQAMTTTPAGLASLGAILVLQTTGLLWIRRMVRVELQA